MLELLDWHGSKSTLEICNRILPWNVACMRLPSPVLIHGILPAIFFTSHLKEDEGALETGVQWPGHIVVDPLPPLTSCTPPRWCPRPQLSLQSLVLGAQLPHSSALLGVHARPPFAHAHPGLCRRGIRWSRQRRWRRPLGSSRCSSLQLERGVPSSWEWLLCSIFLQKSVFLSLSAPLFYGLCVHQYE